MFRGIFWGLLEMIAVFRVGDVFAGRYRLDQKIGQGGMGVVFRATQFPLERPVAVKFISIGQDDPMLRDMFVQEARISSQLQHENIVQVIDFGEEAGQLLYLVSAYVVGTDLARVMAHAPAGLPVPLAFYVTLNVLYAIQHAHEHNVLHRDIKPSNVLISHAGGVQVIDFGIAKIVDPSRTPSISTVLKGSPGYLAPEAVRGLPLRLNADLFSVGGLLWECLTGHNPFVQESNERERIFYNSVHQDLPPISSLVAVPQGSDYLVARLLAKQPEERYQNAAEVIDDLINIGAPHAQQATRGELRKFLRATMETMIEQPTPMLPGFTPAMSGPKPPAASAPSIRTSGMAGEVAVPRSTVTGRERPRGRPRLAVGMAGASLALAAAGGVLWALRAPQGTGVQIAAAQQPSTAGAPDARPERVTEPSPGPKLGRLTLSVSPADAKVLVDGRGISGPPYVATDIPVGSTARLRIERDGYAAENQDVLVGEDTRRSIDLRPAERETDHAQPIRPASSRPRDDKRRHDKKEGPAKTPATTTPETVDKEGTFKKL
jgi:serine/threonine-protein kinase